MSKIFLSYAHEDIGIAKKIYNDLRSYNLEVWFDNESLMPGQNWKSSIEVAIKESKYYLVLLSSNSMNKRGFVQKELSIALEILGQCPENDIFIVPVRVDECKPSFIKMNDIHWIDIFPEYNYANGFKKILKVLSPETHVLRHKPTTLSQSDVVKMIRRHNLFEINKNPDGKGIQHDYKKEIIDNDFLITDKINCLEWQFEIMGNVLDYNDAKNRIQELNNKKFADSDDWRLPTLEEAMSIMEPTKNKLNRYLDPIFGSKNFRNVWTSDIVTNEEKAWVIYYPDGDCLTSYFYHFFDVLAVRSNK